MYYPIEKALALPIGYLFNIDVVKNNEYYTIRLNEKDNKQRHITNYIYNKQKEKEDVFITIKQRNNYLIIETSNETKTFKLNLNKIEIMSNFNVESIKRQKEIDKIVENAMKMLNKYGIQISAESNCRCDVPHLTIIKDGKEYLNHSTPFNMIKRG